MDRIPIALGVALVAIGVIGIIDRVVRHVCSKARRGQSAAPESQDEERQP